MACNCKVNRQLDYLHKKYGNKIPVSNGKLFRFNMKEILKSFFVFLLLIVAFPFMFLHAMFMAFSPNKKISIKKLISFATF